MKKRVVKTKRTTPAQWQDALQEFLYFKQAQGLRPSTVSDYKYHVEQFFKRHPEASDPKNIRSAILVYMTEPIKPATYNLRLQYLRQFFFFCVEQGTYESSPMEGLKKQRQEARIVNLSTETLTKLIYLPNKRTYAGLRDYALILLSLDTGIRPKEAFSLEISDINLNALEVYVRGDVSKTKVSRTLPISPVTRNAIRTLIANRHASWGETIPVFCTTDGTVLNRNTWGDRLEVYSKQLGVRVRPYDLRHAFALQYLRNGGNALALQRTMGHSDLSMTKRYVALTESDIKEQHVVASPINSLLPEKRRVRKAK